MKVQFGTIINATAFQITLAHLALRVHPAPLNDNDRADRHPGLEPMFGSAATLRPVGPYVGDDPPNHSN